MTTAKGAGCEVPRAKGGGFAVPAADGDAHGAPADGGTRDVREAERNEQARFHYMYVVECADGTLYTGYARDVDARVEVHNAGRGAKYTASRRPVRLVASACFSSKHDAMSAEFRFKRLSRPRKLELLEAAAHVPFEEVLAAYL